MALTALLPDTLPKPNPHSDYRIMLLPYYQNGADLGFVVAKRLMGIEERAGGELTDSVIMWQTWSGLLIT